MGDDSKDVAVGSLIAVLAELGEDWKQIQSLSFSSSSTSSISNKQDVSAVINDDHTTGRQYT
jgi:hypothetical protein